MTTDCENVMRAEPKSNEDSAENKEQSPQSDSKES